MLGFKRRTLRCLGSRQTRPGQVERNLAPIFAVWPRAAIQPHQVERTVRPLFGAIVSPGEVAIGRRGTASDVPRCYYYYFFHSRVQCIHRCYCYDAINKCRTRRFSHVCCVVVVGLERVMLASRVFLFWSFVCSWASRGCWYPEAHPELGGVLSVFRA